MTVPEVKQERKAPFRNLQKLALASASPRRRRLLTSMGLEFEVLVSGAAEENQMSGESPEAAARRWAGEKAESVSLLRPDCWVLAADTIVVLDGRIFGKPESVERAEEMLRRLAGRTHEVVSGMSLVHRDRGFRRIGSVVTRVRFKKLSEAEIRAYAGSGEPMDKAGAYGIQGLGAFLVESIDGSYTNVVGLPLSHVVEWFLEEGVIAPAAN